jgi:hypothetical protein
MDDPVWVPTVFTKNRDPRLCRLPGPGRPGSGVTRPPPAPCRSLVVDHPGEIGWSLVGQAGLYRSPPPEKGLVVDAALHGNRVFYATRRYRA